MLAALIQPVIAPKALADTPVVLAQATQSGSDTAPAGVTPSAPPTAQAPQPPSSETAAAATQPPPDGGDPNVTAVRQAFDRALVDAAVLRSQYDESKRPGSKTKVSLSAFRSVEIRLKEFVDADPSNTQARDMMNSMQQAQGEILGPSIAVAAGASRQLYADELGQHLAALGYEVSANGRAFGNLLIVGAGRMTSAVALDLDSKEKIFDHVKMLQFEKVLFSGKRGGKFNVSQDRFANIASDAKGKSDADVSTNANVSSDQDKAGPNTSGARETSRHGRKVIRLPNLYRFIRRVL